MATVTNTIDPILRANTVIRQYVKGAVDGLSRRRITWANLRKKGRIKMKQGADGFQWQLIKKRAGVKVNNGAQPVLPTPVERWGKFYLDYEGFQVDDRMSKREKLKSMHGGAATIIDAPAQIAKNLLADIEAGTNEEFFIDGPANAGHWNGFQSFTAYTQTIDYSQASATVARTANAADPFAYPNDSYAGISTELGDEGGSDGTGRHGWPFSTPTEEWDCATPVIARAQSTKWGGTTWEANAVKCTRLSLMMNKKNQSFRAKGSANWLLMTVEMFFDLANNFDGKERVMVSDVMRMPEYGLEEHQDAINIDGCYCTWEADVPSRKAFGFNFNHVTVKSMQDDLFVLDKDAPHWDPLTRSEFWIVDCLGQLQFDTPRNFFLIDDDY